eukprot:1157757-Pelagomonas_calceolata.AAC.19
MQKTAEMYGLGHGSTSSSTGHAEPCSIVSIEHGIWHQLPSAAHQLHDLRNPLSVSCASAA